MRRDIVRTRIISVFNYLTPIVQTIARTGLDFTQSQVLPRIVAAAAAIVTTTPPRSQQRDFNINIVVAPLINPRQANVITHQSSSHISNPVPELSPAQETPSSPPAVSPDPHRPTSVALYTVIVVPPSAHTR